MATAISLWPVVVHGSSGVTFEFRDAPSDSFGGLNETQVVQGGTFSMEAWIHAFEPVAVVSFKPKFLEYSSVAPATFTITALNRTGSAIPNPNGVDSSVPGETLNPDNVSDLGAYVDPGATPDSVTGDQFVVRISFVVDLSMPPGTYTLVHSDGLTTWGKPVEGGEFAFSGYTPYSVHVLAVPEPGEYALAAGFGLLGLAAFRRYRQNQIAR